MRGNAAKARSAPVVESDEKKGKEDKALQPRLDINANIVVEARTESDTVPSSGVEEAGTAECFYCGSAAKLQCSHCQGIFYCSQVKTEVVLTGSIVESLFIFLTKYLWLCRQEHLVIHRPAGYCYPFIVRRDPVVGRYTVASRDIQPCEVSLQQSCISHLCCAAGCVAGAARRVRPLHPHPAPLPCLLRPPPPRPAPLPRMRSALLHRALRLQPHTQTGQLVGPLVGWSVLRPRVSGRGRMTDGGNSYTNTGIPRGDLNSWAQLSRCGTSHSASL